MNASSHLEKIAKLEELRRRLDPVGDFELWFWAGMTAGTHAVNAALHHAKVTEDDDVFPTQPGVYLVPQANGSLRRSWSDTAIPACGTGTSRHTKSSKNATAPSAAA